MATVRRVRQGCTVLPASAAPRERPKASRLGNGNDRPSFRPGLSRHESQDERRPSARRMSHELKQHIAFAARFAPHCCRTACAFASIAYATRTSGNHFLQSVPRPPALRAKLKPAPMATDAAALAKIDKGTLQSLIDSALGSFGRNK